MTLAPLPRTRLARRLCLVAALALASCQKEEDIRHYTAPKAESPPLPAVKDATASTAKQRLLGAIVPHGDELWVFKLMGPEAAVTPHEAEFATFVDSIRFKDGNNRPTYQPPETWKPSKGTQFSVAAFRVGADEQAPELTVTPSRGSVDENIARWRGQLNYKPGDAADDPKARQEKDVNGVKVMLVDLTGTGSGGMGRPPFAGKAPHPPIPAERPAGKGGSSRLTYTVPAGWVEGPQTQFSQASFQAGQGRDAASVTVTALAGTGGGLLSNVNRWRGQAGLPAWTEEQFSKESATLMIAGTPAVAVDLVGKGEAAGKRIVAAVLTRGGETWFFKLIGPDEAVGRQKAAFEAFVKSVRFKGDAANE